jgi:hypothetical protein
MPSLSSDALYAEWGSNNTAEMMSPEEKVKQTMVKFAYTPPNSSTHSATSLPCLEGRSADDMCASQLPNDDNQKRKGIAIDSSRVKKQKSLDIGQEDGSDHLPGEATASANPYKS